MPLNKKKEIHSLSRVSTPRYVSAATLDWAAIVAAALVSEHVATWPAYLIAAVFIASRQHALMILVHDATHFRAHKKPFWNDLISDLLCAFPVFFDTYIYRRRHMQHHDHLNSEKDPDWVRKIPFAEWQFPKTRVGYFLMFLRYSLGRGTLEWVYATWYFSGLSKASPYPPDQKKRKLALKSAFWLIIMGGFVAAGALKVLALYWILPFYGFFPLFQRLRSIAEHFGLDYAGDLRSSRDVIPGPIEAYFLSPHNVNLHLSHHLHPSVPFHNLSKLQALLESEPTYARFAVVNSSYLLPRGNSLWRDVIAKPPEFHAPPDTKDQSKAG